ncbi:uncharacterized protein with von Willebrand factor type A (vWA) domain [Paraburkholderia sp. MM5482-R2]
MSEACVPERHASSGTRLLQHVVAFARALRTAGVCTDASKIALGVKAISLVGIAAREDAGAALESVLISREADRLVFRALFAVWFSAGDSRDLLYGKEASCETIGAEAPQELRRIRDSAPEWSRLRTEPGVEYHIRFDGPMAASDKERLRHSDFGTLDASEYREVQRLARDITLARPAERARRYRTTLGHRGGYRIDWPQAVREGVRTGGELIRLPRSKRRRQVLPLLAMVDVSGSMERYARVLLAFLHAAVTRESRTDVFVFGTHLTDLTPYFQRGDVDAMLLLANAAIDDFAGGTRIGGSLGELRRRYPHRFVGGRTVVVLITDGLETGSPEVLHNELQLLKRRARCVLWLNPMMRFEGYAPAARGASALHQYADAMLAAYNLSALEQVAGHLAQLLASSR